MLGVKSKLLIIFRGPEYIGSAGEVFALTGLLKLGLKAKVT